MIRHMERRRRTRQQKPSHSRIFLEKALQLHAHLSLVMPNVLPNAAPQASSSETHVLVSNFSSNLATTEAGRSAPWPLLNTKWTYRKNSGQSDRCNHPIHPKKCITSSSSPSSLQNAHPASPAPFPSSSSQPRLPHSDDPHPSSPHPPPPPPLHPDQRPCSHSPPSHS